MSFLRWCRSFGLFVVVVPAYGGCAESSNGAPPATPPPTATPTTNIFCPPAAGRVLTVGPGKTFATIRAAALAAQNGDTIHISAGDYRSDVATWRANDLSICGVGGRARLFADGAHEGGKGIWVITGRDTTIVDVEFHDAKVPDRNGAGIRFEGRNLTLRSTAFFDNENGILTGHDSASTITIERSEFARNGFGDGYTHNLYVGRVGRLNVRLSYFHEARIGHQLKSRARENVIEQSYFVDGPSGTSSYLLNFDNGGRAVVRGNLLHKGPHADNSVLITHYSNIWGVDYNSLVLEHNTLVSTYPGGRFIDVKTGAAVTLRANIFAGTNGPALLRGGVAVDQHNVIASAVEIPGAADILQPNFWPTDSLLSRLVLPDPVVANYQTDSPRPFASRVLAAPPRLVGALQAAP